MFPEWERSHTDILDMSYFLIYIKQQFLVILAYKYALFVTLCACSRTKLFIVLNLRVLKAGNADVVVDYLKISSVRQDDVRLEAGSE